MKKTYIEYIDVPALLPSIDYFVDKVNNNEPFHFIRVNHGVWDLIHFAYENNLNQFKKDYTNKEFKKISKVVEKHHLNNEFYKHSYGEGIKFWHKNSNRFAEFFENLLRFLSEYDSSTKYKIGLAGGVGLHTEFGIYAADSPIQIGRSNIIKHIVSESNNSEDFFYSGVVKHYVIMNEIQKLINTLNNKDFTIIFFGHFKYSEFGERYNIKNFKFVEIPVKGAMNTFDEYVDKVKEICDDNEKTFIFHSCGHILSAYLAKQTENTKLFGMDVGKSFQIDMSELFPWKGDWFNPVNYDVKSARERYKSYIKKLRNG